MKLIPEQVANLREGIRRKEEAIASYNDYLSDKMSEALDQEYLCRYNDGITDGRLGSDIKDLKEYRDALITGELVMKPATDKIDIGTTFIVKFSDDEEPEKLTMTEEIRWLDRKNGYVTVNSKLGQCILGKKVGEEFCYSVGEGTRKTKISGTIEEIKKATSDYLQYIRNQGHSTRMRSKEKEYRKKLSEESRFSETARIEYEKLKEITISQKQLVEEEIARLQTGPRVNYENPEYRKRRLDYLKRYINNPKIAVPPTDGTIGIGSNFSLMIFTPDGKTETRRVELINGAISTELENEYIEKISSIGYEVFGLKENEEFFYHINNGQYISGIVYDIDNSKNMQKTSDPLVYQKEIKRR